MIKIINGKTDPDKIFARVSPKVDVSNIVAEIIDTVRKDGDKALISYAEKFDKVKLSSLLVSKEEILEAVESVEGIESVENVVVEEVVINNIEEVKEDVKDLAMASNSKAGGNPKSEIEEWETAFDEATRPNTKRRINFENILKISSSDVDKHFEKIKEVTTLAIKRAEEKALVIKQKIEDRMDDEDIENPSVVTKFKSIANKLKNFKKK